VSEVRVKLGDVYVALGHHEQAARNFEQALAISRERGDPAHEADALSSLGDVLLRRGELDQAYAHYFTALQLASEIGSLRRQTRAQAGLARTHQADAGSVQTQYPRQEALTRDPGIGTPEASDE
jgi:tetratricopeptide (TPR) repeat protein